MTSTPPTAIQMSPPSDQQMSDSPAWPRNYRTGIWALVVCYVGWSLWAIGNSSLWLDETITAWVTSGDLPTCIHRAWNFQGQSPLYFMLVWGVRQVLGGSEFALRSLSLLSAIGSAAIFPSILRRFGLHRDAWLGPLIVVVVILSEYNTGIYELRTADTGLNARPYSIAIFSSLISLYCLLHWIDTRTWMMWLTYSAVTTVTLMLHYLFAPFLAFHLFVLFKRTRGDRRAMLAWLGSLCVVGAGLLPVLPHLVLVTQKSKNYESAKLPTFFDTLAQLFVLNGMWRVIALTCIFGLIRPRLDLTAVDRDTAILGLTWWSLPPICLAILYLVTGISLNAPRYLLWRLPAVALLIIAMLQAVYSHRFVALPAFLCVPFMIPVIQSHDRSGWKEAVEWAEHYTSHAGDYQPVLYSGLIETATPDWLDDEEFRSYLLAPLDYYSGPQQAELLPIYYRSMTAEIFQKKMDDLIDHHDRMIIFLRHEPVASRPVHKMLSDAGYSIVDGQKFQLVDVIVASRIADDSAPTHAESE
jgi:hypothetical protein